MLRKGQRVRPRRRGGLAVVASDKRRRTRHVCSMCGIPFDPAGSGLSDHLCPECYDCNTWETTHRDICVCTDAPVPGCPICAGIRPSGRRNGTYDELPG